MKHISNRLAACAWLALLAPLLAAADGDGCNADKSLGGNNPEPTVEACGPNNCEVGEQCCDDSCGACSPEGDDCPADACPSVTTCGNETCNAQQACCNDSCCLPIGATCAAESCQANEIACGSEVCNGATEACCIADMCTTCIPKDSICNGAACN